MDLAFAAMEDHKFDIGLLLDDLQRRVNDAVIPLRVRSELRGIIADILFEGLKD